LYIKRQIFEVPPEGNFPAVITTVADLGLQESNWQGEINRAYKIGLAFELVGKTTTDGRPFAVFDRVNCSLHEKSRLAPIVSAALGTVPNELDPRDLLGHPVLVRVVHKDGQDGKVWANIGSVTPIPDGMAIPTTDTPLLYFDLAEPDDAVYQKLPALFRKLIENRVNAEVPVTEETPAVDVPW
jgi:hypothetical protein